MTRQSTWRIESLCKKGLRSFGGVYTETRLYFCFIGAGTCRQESETDNGCEKEYETQSDETLEPTNVPETIYYLTRF